MIRDDLVFALLDALDRGEHPPPPPGKSLADAWIALPYALRAKLAYVETDEHLPGVLVGVTHTGKVELRRTREHRAALAEYDQGRLDL